MNDAVFEWLAAIILSLLTVCISVITVCMFIKVVLG